MLSSSANIESGSPLAGAAAEDPDPDTVHPITLLYLTLPLPYIFFLICGYHTLPITTYLPAYLNLERKCTGRPSHLTTTSTQTPSIWLLQTSRPALRAALATGQFVNIIVVVRHLAWISTATKSTSSSAPVTCCLSSLVSLIRRYLPYLVSNCTPRPFFFMSLSSHGHLISASLAFPLHSPDRHTHIHWIHCIAQPSTPTCPPLHNNNLLHPVHLDPIAWSRNRRFPWLISVFVRYL